ncbi:hypothetical protein JOQ06_017051 [Pogonophryne albipinna]|uniref:Neuromodulin n=1 Tax=Pogonophryne albipinna TaxID=1090488 RepID=A0AAD6B3G8_9TELE|nr:hypothetical protein JOQ06_017051 [Pogonophryne albipinna]
MQEEQAAVRQTGRERTSGRVECSWCTWRYGGDGREVVSEGNLVGKEAEQVEKNEDADQKIEQDGTTNKPEDKAHKAATKIQASFRGHITRKKMKDGEEEKEEDSPAAAEEATEGGEEKKKVEGEEAPAKEEEAAGEEAKKEETSHAKSPVAENPIAEKEEPNQTNDKQDAAEESKAEEAAPADAVAEGTQSKDD